MCVQLGEDKPFLEILPDVIKSYGLSMMHGHQHTSQSLPRMLTLWFEFGTFLQAFRSAAKLTVRGRGRGAAAKGGASGDRIVCMFCMFCTPLHCTANHRPFHP